MDTNNTTTTRTKRNIKKPQRFQTTSSDEQPRKWCKKTRNSAGTNKILAEDISELQVLHDEDTYSSSSEILSEDFEERADQTSPSQRMSQMDDENQVQAVVRSNIDSTQSMSQCSNANTSRNSHSTNTTLGTNTTSVVLTDISQNTPTVLNKTSNVSSSSSSSTTLPYGQQHYPNVYSSNPPQSTQVLYQQENNKSNPCLPSTQPPYMPEYIPHMNYISYEHDTYKCHPMTTGHNAVRRALQPSMSNNRLEDCLDKIDQRLEKMDQHQNKIDQHLHNIDERIQNVIHVVRRLTKEKSKRLITKPDVLPIGTVEQMISFDKIEDEKYKQVIQYFEFLGGFHVKEVVTMCFKEAIIDTVTLSYTWWGKDQKRSFCTTRIVNAIFEAACNNTNFAPPTRLEFHKVMKETLRTAQERCRNRNKQKTTSAAIREFWHDNTRITTENTENIEPEINVQNYTRLQ